MDKLSSSFLLVLALLVPRGGGGVALFILNLLRRRRLGAGLEPEQKIRWASDRRRFPAAPRDAAVGYVRFERDFSRGVALVKGV